MSPDASSEVAVDGASALMGACPIPISDYREIVLAHGSGGKLSQQLIQKLILPQFGNDLLNPLHDGAIFSVNGARLAFSTDSYVISPIFFPGGDIGTLAVHGTVNDLAMCGARPLYLSAGFILEEVRQFRISGGLFSRCGRQPTRQECSLSRAIRRSLTVGKRTRSSSTHPASALFRMV